MEAEFHTADRGSGGLLVAADRRQIVDELDALMIRLDAARRYDIGFPGSSDLHHAPLADLMTRYLINNIGDPYEDNLGLNETKAFERAVLDLVAELFRAPAGGW